MIDVDFTTTASETPRQRILLTAHALFYRFGIRATGVDRVIAASGIAKATFYRHFPSKNDLILATLDYRHRRWMSWFRSALARHGGGKQGLIMALAEWFDDEEFRGCAFLNAVGEMATELPEIAARARSHKAEMVKAIVALLPEDRADRADAVSLAVDGAVLRVQMGEPPRDVLDALERIVTALVSD